MRFHRVEVDLSRREQKTELYLSKNPRGIVPAYEDSNVVIGDSLDIMRYIDANTPDPHLFPDDPKALVEVLAWIE